MKLRWDEKGKLVIAAGVCLFFLIVAMLLPLAFRRQAAPKDTAGETADELSAAERAELFAVYWNDGAEESGLSVEHSAESDRHTSVFCENRMEELTARWIDDRAVYETEPVGSDYTVISDERGTLRLCRMWLRSRGDWQNWLDVCFDADTGAVYYLYVSRECLNNVNRYRNGARPAAEELAEELADFFGGSVREFRQGSDGGTVLLRAGGGILCYEIGTVYYDTLIDVRIDCIY